MASIEEKLQRKLYRAFCPDSMELDDYVTGQLSHERTAFIREHLQECPHCRREIEQMQDFLAQTRPDLELNLAERLRILAARLVKPSGGGGWTPALQGVRGEAELAITYEADGLLVVLDVQADPDRADLRTIYGLIIGEQAGQGFQAHLRQDGAPVASAEVDEFGNFTLPSIAPRSYALALAGPGVEIRIEELVIE